MVMIFTMVLEKNCPRIYLPCRKRFTLTLSAASSFTVA